MSPSPCSVNPLKTYLPDRVDERAARWQWQAHHEVEQEKDALELHREVNLEEVVEQEVQLQSRRERVFQRREHESAKH